MATKIAINGFGRIGRPVFKRILDKHPDLEVVAINDLADNETLSHLLKYDSIYGIYNREVSFTEKGILIDGKEFTVFNEKDPENLPWKELEVDIVLECTGIFTDLKGSEKHINAGAKMVIMSAPAKDKEIPSYILGINEENFDSKKDKIVDMGSCTTNCLAPIVKTINDKFQIIKGFMTTTHSYTNDQRILDLAHKDLRRARAAALNIIPTSTGAAKAIGKVIPDLQGKLDGISLRVPTPTVSALDIIIEIKKESSKEEIINAIREKEEKIPNILKVEEKPLVSTDYIGNSHSSIVDAPFLMVNGNMIKVLAWYDNEYGYSCRLAEFAEYVSKKI
jgi:glyceraldehyde 3-phosphate dehydrogenase